MPATPFSILNFKWVWQTQGLSHTPKILKNYVFFIDIQMILLSLFDTSNQKSIVWKKAILIFKFRPPFAFPEESKKLPVVYHQEFFVSPGS